MIYYVEDNPDDTTLFSLAFRKAGASAQLRIAADGDQAISELSLLADQDLPDCIILDIQLPGMSGLEVLSWIRGQARLKRLPVIMLTSSLLPHDISQAYQRGANSYLAKPPDLESLVQLVGILERYWTVANFPPPGRGLLKPASTTVTA